MSRREEGFRVADTRQVRIESLERKVKVLREERDAARAETNTAKRLALSLDRQATDARGAAAIHEQAAIIARQNLRIASESMARDLKQLQASLAEEIAHRSIRARVKRWLRRPFARGAQ